MILVPEKLVFLLPEPVFEVKFDSVCRPKIDLLLRRFKLVQMNEFPSLPEKIEHEKAKKKKYGKNFQKKMAYTAKMKAGADIDALNNRRETPLLIAAATGYLDICKLLISKGAAIDAIDCGKETPLHRAVATGNLDICQLLISKSAAIDAIDCERLR
ncbi:ankyrin repeat domain-containing protein 39-like [Artemia franciscana]|uniref:ankyrin repeat domain-containing protein 39-like n=1 Tax=Artemia franciscana TaxID=6661 RepID=UPI0032DA54C2